MMADSSEPPNLVDQILTSIFSRYHTSLSRSHRLRSTSSATGVTSIEWAILTSVCLVPLRGDFPPTPIALGTGTKALPFNKVSKPGVGDVLHDCHAEIMARRGARDWVCSRVVAERAAREMGMADVDGLPLLFQPSPDGTGRLRLREDVQCWWYVSTLPCGECSSPSLARRHEEEDRLRAADGTGQQPDGDAVQASPSNGVVRGRHHLASHSSHTSTPPMLRTVPGRRDSPPSISHSCTDKLLLWTLTGWQGSALSRWVEPIGIDTLIISHPAGPAASSSEHKVIATEVQRGLDVNARLPATASSCDYPAPPRVVIVRQQFEHSQQVLQSRNDLACADVVELIPSWTSTSWIRPSQEDGSGGRARDVEVIVGGIKQGGSHRRGEEGRVKGKSRSRLCKVSYMRKLQGLLRDANRQQTTYAALKGKASSVAPADDGVALYREYKDKLRGGDGEGQAAWDRLEAWLQRAQGNNTSDDSGEPAEDTAATAPLAGWLITPTDIEHFTIDGKRVDHSTASGQVQGPA